ncbi:hypothetical protein B0J13DRAFT_666224 [Dactylonectria estremocensis]|uniref:Uncharacterized protein n=1 Tax=Dactylonectria estremocensis TaxID=1079267 RepID=A0A9P9EVB5_9HYPO|nr:hypothetical protein B0J13DRAFT_666224 [Dactylonectria estremocensis]
MASRWPRPCDDMGVVPLRERGPWPGAGAHAPQAGGSGCDWQRKRLPFAASVGDWEMSWMPTDQHLATPFPPSKTNNKMTSTGQRQAHCVITMSEAGCCLAGIQPNSTRALEIVQHPLHQPVLARPINGECSAAAQAAPPRTTVPTAPIVTEDQQRDPRGASSLQPGTNSPSNTLTAAHQQRPTPTNSAVPGLARCRANAPRNYPGHAAAALHFPPKKLKWMEGDGTLRSLGPW